MPAREALHHLVDDLPDDEIARAERVLRALLESAEEEGPLHALDSAPEDDEPPSDEERLAVEEGLRDLREGRTVSHEEVKRRWGLG